MPLLGHLVQPWLCFKQQEHHPSCSNIPCSVPRTRCVQCSASAGRWKVKVVALTARKESAGSFQGPWFIPLKALRKHCCLLHFAFASCQSGHTPWINEDANTAVQPYEHFIFSFPCKTYRPSLWKRKKKKKGKGPLQIISWNSELRKH